MPRPLPVHAEKFLASIDAAPRTVITYQQALHAFAEFITARSRQEARPVQGAAAVSLKTLQEDALADFRHWLRNEQKFGRRTERTYLAGTLRFIDWLDAQSLLPAGLLASRMKLLLRETRGRRRVGYKTQPIKEAVPQIIDYYMSLPLPSPDTPRSRRQRLTILRNRAIVQTLFASGLRAQELASLCRSDCSDGRSDTILITGKGEKERLIILNAEARSAIRAYLQARDEARLGRERGALSVPTGRDDPLFVRHDRDKLAPITTKTVWQVIHQAARTLGLTSTVSPHDFRRYIATAMLSEGMPLESVQMFLGHESIVTTRTVYAHTRAEVLEDQVKTYRPTPSQALKRSRSVRP